MNLFFFRPGVIKSNFPLQIGWNEKSVSILMDRLAKVLPVGRVGEGEDIANAVLFLASDISSFTTGTSLLTDGGHLAANIFIQ